MVFDQHSQNRFLLVGSLGLLFHAGALYPPLVTDSGLNLALTNSLSLVAWVIVLLFFITTLRQPIQNLGVVILPVAALSVLAQWLWPVTGSGLVMTGARSFHIIISLLAYSLLSLAVVQSMVVLVQERRLHKHQLGHILQALPPLQTMETLMVNMVLVGFAMLTITVVTGIFFSEQTFGKAFNFNHHIFLSLLAWAVFGIFLIGRWQRGWRGRFAVNWVLGGGILLILGYLGTKFVLEILLHRA